MKKTILFLILSAIVGSMNATNQLTIEPFFIAAGETKAVSINLTMQNATYRGLQFKLVLPEGVTVALNNKGKLDFKLNDDRIDGHSATISQPSAGTYSVVVAALSDAIFYEEEGEFITVKLTASATATSGVFQGAITDQMLAIDSNTSDTPANTSFNCTVTGTIATGIEQTATGITVEDGATMGLIPETVTTTALTYTRELTGASSGEMYTVCLPYTPPTDENLKYYTLSTVSGTTLTFDEVTTPEAYKPYLVVASATSSVGTTVAQSVDLSTGITGTTETGGEYELCGTLYGMTNAEAAAGGNIYILQDAGKWGKVTTANTAADIPPFRAYIVKKSVGGSARLHSVIGNATGIKPISVSSEGESKGVWYTLGGLELTGEPTQKGAYVKDGRVIIK